MIYKKGFKNRSMKKLNNINNSQIKINNKKLA